MSSIFSLTRSALTAAQAGVTVTSQNIANATTEGYSRQAVKQSAAAPQAMGSGFIGRGVEVKTTERVYSQFLGDQMLKAQSSVSSQQAREARLDQLDALVADPDAGLAPAMEEFFGSLQALSTAPDTAAARLGVLSSAEVVAGRFRATADRVAEVQSAINGELEDSVGRVNQLTGQIAEINLTIARAEGMAGGQPANDLLDQRDVLLRDLSKEVGLTITRQADGRLDLSMGNGQPLLVGQSVFELEARPSGTNPLQLEVAFKGSAPGANLGPSTVSGGRLGGLLEVRSQSVNPLADGLDRLAYTFASEVNRVHATGVRPDGGAGEPIFSLPAPTVTADARNTGTAVLNASISDLGTLGASPLMLRQTGGQAQLVRTSDGAVLAQDANLSTVLTAAQDQGVSLSLASGSLAEGDRILIAPARSSALSMEVQIQSADGLATSAGSYRTGDNTTVLALIDLQSAKTLNSGTSSLQGEYGALVSRVGVQTREAQLQAEAGASVLASSETAVQQVSGVNLDEEAANLLKYQQAYQAAGKVMQIAQSMFETLLSVSRA